MVRMGSTVRIRLAAPSKKALCKAELNPEKRTLREKASCCRITVTGGIYFEENMDKRRKISANNNENAQRRVYKTTDRRCTWA